MSTVQNPTDQIPPPPPPPPPQFIPPEIIAVILSFLPVKIIARFRCVSKSWKKLISESSFIKIHLQKSSSLNPNFILTPFLHEYPLNSIVSLPISRLLHNDPSTTLSANTYPNFLNNDEKFSVVDSCNGLLCLLSFWNSIKRVNFNFRIWNPATGTISEKLGFLRENFPRPPGGIKFSFCCDSLTGIYKIMCVHSFRIEDVWKSTLRVFNVGDDNGDCWRYISSPVLLGSGGVHLNVNIIWSTLSEDLNILGGTINIKRVGVAPHVDFFKMVSLDLSTEKFREILHPKDFEDMPCGKTNLRVLLDCLCLCHDFRKTEFVIWQMKEFGVQDSWTKIFRIRFIDLQMPNIEVDNLDHSPLVPLYISKDGDTVILSSKEVDKAIIYNKRDNSVVRTAISNDIYWFYAKDYVESLVPTPWKSGDIEAMKDEDDDDDDDVGGGFRFFRVFLDEDDDGGGGGDGDGDGGGGGDDDDGGGGGDDDDDDVDDDDEVGGGGGFIFIGVFHGGQNRD